MKTDKLNPDLMIGDEVTVIDVDSSFGTMNTAERFKDYVVTAIKQSNQTQETYYDVKPINETDEELLGRMLAGGGMIRREHLYPTDTWMLRKGFLRGEHLSEHKESKKLNPELMVGDEIMVVSTEGIHDGSYGVVSTSVWPELYKPYVVVGIKHGTTMMKGGKELEDYPYYQVEPVGMTDEDRTGAMLAGGGRMRPMYIFPRQDKWILRKGFRRGEHLSEHKIQPEISPELEVGDNIMVVDVDREVENNAIKYHIPAPELRPEKFTSYTVVDKESNGSKSKYPFRYTLVPTDKFEEYQKSVDRGYGDYEGYEKLLFPWVHDWIIHKSKINEHNQPGLNPELEVGDIVRVIDVDGEHARMPDRFGLYKVVKTRDRTRETLTQDYYDIVPAGYEDEVWSDLDMKTLYRGDTWIYGATPMANKVDRKTISEQVNPEDYGIVDGEKRDAEAAKSNTPGAPDRTPFTKLESTILKQLHKTLDRSDLQAVVEETPGDWGPGKKFWNVMKIFGVNYRRDMVEDTRVTKYAKWALDNWTEDGDYASIERPIKEKLKWFEIDREETGSQVEYKDGSAEVLGFDEDDASTRADYDFYSWGGEMETNDYGDYETYDSEITRSDFIRVDEGLTPKMVEELKGPKEIQDLLFNFWKKHGPTLDPDRLKLIGFNMNDADDRTKVTFNLVEYYGDEELINIITDRLEGIQGWEYEYVVTSIDFHDLLNFKSYPFTIMVDVIVDGSTEVPVSTEDGIEDMTLWETNERAQKEWKGGGPGPYDNVYEEVREQVLSDVSILLKNLPVEPMLDYVDFSEPNDSIDNYVGTPEIMTESKLDKLVWKEKPLKKHEKRMEKDFGVFEGFPIKDFMNTNPPKNGSEEAMDELMLLDSLPLIDEFVDTTDDIFPHFEKYFKEKDLEFPEEELKNITKDTSPIILKLKYHYNRPRPQQLANAKGLKFHQEPLDSSKTPAYPSGHATQGRLIAKILSDKFPKHESEINKLGNEIGTGRLVAKVHYPSDDLFGKELGDALYKFIKDKKVLEEQVTVDKGDMLKADIFRFLSNRFALLPTEYGTTPIKDMEGNYYRLIDMEEPDEDVNLSHLLDPVVDMVSYGIKSGVFKDGDVEKGITAITDWISLSMNQKKDLMN